MGRGSADVGGRPPPSDQRRIPQETEEFRGHVTTKGERPKQEPAGGPAAQQWAKSRSADAPLPTSAEERRGPSLNARNGPEEQKERYENGRKSPRPPCSLYEHRSFGSWRARRNMQARFGAAGN